ncbi:hypothetical protein RRG08_008673 [Elysia crispata]|uniref:Helitron helicase-like domain-containing protein n=1 Tax=Elysia crispata TaxID=231223 RepID=A0AAE1CNV9_9GAST|nr:hypothetical protein RRG08_008673 [Elysia crispata]
MSIERIYTAHPTEGERFFLRLLLQHVKGAESFEDIRRSPVRILYPTFRQAASSMGLLEDDEEWVDCMTETAFTASLSQFMHLFATILLFCNPSSPVTLWDTLKKQLSEDFYYQLYGDERTTLGNRCTKMALIEINNILAQHKKKNH